MQFVCIFQLNIYKKLMMGGIFFKIVPILLKFSIPNLFIYLFIYNEVHTL